MSARLTRYFPELVGRGLRRAAAALRDRRRDRDRRTEHGLDFEALQLRLHPAASGSSCWPIRTPAAFIAFDLLALGDEDLTAARSRNGAPLWSRR